MTGAPLVPLPSASVLPAPIADAVNLASLRFLEFFAVNFRNKNPRTVYARAAGRSCAGVRIGA